GVAALLAPMLTIRPAPGAARLLAERLTGAQAVLFTSANGVRAFAAASGRRPRRRARRARLHRPSRGTVRGGPGRRARARGGRGDAARRGGAGAFFLSPHGDDLC